jgi:hypothetical protein
MSKGFLSIGKYPFSLALRISQLLGAACCGMENDKSIIPTGLSVRSNELGKELP